ncbi:MAG: BirA family biotin operon repressor/biotin-[acetyl-CoA-carboxylase] ligase [Arcticibacterium sp.]
MYKLQPKTLFIGKNTVYLPTCHSTNDWAAQIIQKEEPLEGTIVITDNQTRGKGQRGNEWRVEAKKNLTFTLILKPTFLPITQQFNLNLAISLAVIETLSPYLGEELKIKWPNDILYKDKKLGGILVESLISGKTMNYSLLGIGLNINQQQFEFPMATSLSTESKGDLFNLSALLEHFCGFMENNYLRLKNGQERELKKEYLRVLFGKGMWREFKKGGKIFKGKIMDVSPKGLLMMETELGLKQFDTKEFEYKY